MFRRPLLLVLPVIAVAAFAAFLLLRPSSEQSARAPRVGPEASSSAQQRLVPFAIFRNVRLDTPRAKIERQFGTPLRSAPGAALDPGTTCLFYRAPADAAPASEYQLCFLRGRLHSKFAG